MFLEQRHLLYHRPRASLSAGLPRELKLASKLYACCCSELLLHIIDFFPIDRLFLKKEKACFLF